MRTTALVTMAAVLALGACSKPTPGSAAKDGNGTAPAPAASSAEVTLNPGEWETVSETQIAGLANLPPEVARRMKDHKVTSRQCLTPEKAAHPGADVFSDKNNKACTNNITMAGGRVQGTLTCKDPQGMASTMTIDGRYGGDSFEMTMKMNSARAGQEMTMTSHSVGRRVGPCTGKE